MNSHFSSLEALEARIAPALVIAPDGHSASFTDLDGDHVTVKVTLGHLTPANFTLDNSFPLVPDGERLIRISLDGSFAGANLIMTAERSGAHGDGLVGVGVLDAPTVPLGKVSIDGDLLAVNAGNGVTALKSLTLKTFGGDLYEKGAIGFSFLNGNVGALTVGGSLHNLHIDVGNAAHSAHLSRLTIGGSLINSSIRSDGTIPLVHLHGDLASVNSAAALSSTYGSLPDVRIGGSIDLGQITAAVRIGSLRLHGDLIGGDGANDGSIHSGLGGIGLLTIGGSIYGGTATNSAAITTDGVIDSIAIHGSVLGQDSTMFLPTIAATGQISPASASQALAIRQVKIGGDFRHAAITAGLDANVDASIGSVQIGGDFYCSHLAAGTTLGPDSLPGTNDDTLPGGGAGVHSRIAQVIIRGHAAGTPMVDQVFDSYYIMAESVGAVRVAGLLVLLSPGANLTQIGFTGDLAVKKAF